MTAPHHSLSKQTSTVRRSPGVRILVATLFSLLLALSVDAHPVGAQELPLSDSLLLIGVSEYDGAVPRPEDVLGYRIGDRHSRPDEVVRYFEAVAEASDRVRYEVHGSTHEGRPLVHAVVTSPSNQSRLAEIRAANLRLFDAPDGVARSELESMPAVVYTWPTACTGTKRADQKRRCWPCITWPPAEELPSTRCSTTSL